MPGGEHSPVAVLDRISTLLDAFDDRERLTLSELARRTGFPRSSTHRMLVQLVRLRWIRRCGDAYELGMKMFELGALALHHDRLHRSALPILHRLHAATGLVVHLGVLAGDDVLYLEKIGGDLGPMVPSRVGGRQPARRTALGKSMLASIDACASTAAPEPFRRELAAIRERDVAHDRDEAALGLSCVAATIGDRWTTVGALSVCGPTGRFHSWALEGPVRAAAHAVWKSIESGYGARELPA
ncbi:IclR family transcriptional regulator [Rhodococcus sp. D2-41]|uniref:IclR family transcriptional regulator n=1 Tax=Speluncibacter jeojiensis TaxID=2710754 RepID=A0A9X4LZ35_9ACTN|nr:IclR family transcriptional regulator [Rhodococcus sp. D2-41]MDG3011630.1 IclR family transcriptional regulator [Rhodococcus sp. D2-41]MDG3015015.1 IclR family transcriptional regulator [Corynebacteriales bacterium D3-21]